MLWLSYVFGLVGFAISLQLCILHPILVGSVATCTAGSWLCHRIWWRKYHHSDGSRKRGVEENTAWRLLKTLDQLFGP